MGITEGQVRAILPAYHDYRARMERLGEDAATALATLQEVQQVRQAAGCGRWVRHLQTWRAELVCCLLGPRHTPPALHWPLFPRSPLTPSSASWRS